jgi:glycerol-3-phosphate acyltransferase PlsY
MLASTWSADFVQETVRIAFGYLFGIRSINWSLALPYFAGAFAIGYLLGSIPFGLIITRLAGTADIRSIGSGNIGATNVLRTGRKALAAATLLGDMLKGTLAVVVVYHYYGVDLSVIAGFGAFLGHLFPIWLKFRGGKGVATYIGLLIGFGWTASAWPAALTFGAVWVATAALTRYSSLAALLASAATPVALWTTGNRQHAQLFILLTVLLWIRHAPNIVRLAKGTEGRIGASASTARGSQTR